MNKTRRKQILAVVSKRERRGEDYPVYLYSPAIRFCALVGTKAIAPEAPRHDWFFEWHAHNKQKDQTMSAMSTFHQRHVDSRAAATDDKQCFPSASAAKHHSEWFPDVFLHRAHRWDHSAGTVTLPGQVSGKSVNREYIAKLFCEHNAVLSWQRGAWRVVQWLEHAQRDCPHSSVSVEKSGMERSGILRVPDQ